MDYIPELEARIQAWAEARTESGRHAHVRGVVETVTRLSERYAPDEIPRVRLAGWIHDAAKNWSDSALLAYAQAHHLPVSDTERAVPMLLHGAVAYALAAEQFGLDDPLLGEACALHTTGAPGMGVAAKIVLLADLIEPSRPDHRVGEVRRAAEQDLDMALLCAVDNVLRHLIRRQRIIDPRAVHLRNDLIAAGVRYVQG